jgi:hypothetical protein
MRSGGVIIDVAKTKVNPAANKDEIFMNYFSELWFDTLYTHYFTTKH